MAKRAWFGAAAAALVMSLTSSPALAGGGSDDKEKDRDRTPGTPFIVGTWKFVPNGTSTPYVDTEFRFVNPTPFDVTLEYAFFNLDGSFCGCDRDEFQPNKTTIYTMLQEKNLGSAIPGGPPVFSCSDTSGALKSIVFFHKGQDIFLGEASQVGFQTHAFGNLVEGDTSLTGAVMTEATMAPVVINDAAREEIKKIHDQCVMVNGPLQ
jgi:hypothetical protein